MKGRYKAQLSSENEQGFPIYFIIDSEGNNRMGRAYNLDNAELIVDALNERWERINNMSKPPQGQYNTNTW